MRPSMRLLQGCRCVALMVAIALLTLPGPVVRRSVADDSFWTNPAGGVFHDALNWSDGIPLPSSEAHFDLVSEFAVTLAGPAVNDKLVVRRGDVTLDLGRLSYSLTSDVIVSEPTARIAVLTATEGMLRSRTLHVGLQPGSAGALRLGAGARYDGADGTSIGHGGIGDAIVEAGALASDATLEIGKLSTGTGKLVVRGAGSQWRTAGDVIVGAEGSGELMVANGGAIKAGSNLVLGQSPSSSALVNVLGEGAIIRSDSLAIARQGSAQLTIDTGGRIDTVLVTIAEDAASSADVSLDGERSTLSARSIFIGGAAATSGGSATLTVVDGAELSLGLSAADTLKIWNDGRLTVDGGLVRAANLARLGTLDFRSGLIEIIGGKLESSGPFVLEGDDPALSPQLHLRDGATTVGLTQLTIGRNRSGTLSLSNGAVVTTENLIIAELPGSTGTATVTGPGSKLGITGSMTVGGTDGASGGAGTLTVADRSLVEIPNGSLKLWPGGTIHLDGGTISVASYDPAGGAFQFSSGTFEVRGGTVVGTHSYLTHLLGPAHEIRAGRQLRLPTVAIESNLLLNGGSLDCATLVNNSAVVASAGRLGSDQFDNGPFGLLRLEGNATLAAAQLINSGEISLNGETAILTGQQLINNGIISGFGRVGLRLQNGAAGEVRSDADKRITFLQAGNVNAGRIEAMNAATVEFRGDLTNEAGGTIVARDGAVRFAGGLTNRGSLTVSAGLGELFGDILNTSVGRITVAGQSTALFYDDLVNQGTVHISDAATAVYLGTVSGSGTFTGKGTVQFEGAFLPGVNGAPTNVEGDLRLTQDSHLIMQLPRAELGNASDPLNVGGTLELGGTFDVATVGDYSPKLGETFDLFDFSLLREEFDSVHLPPLAGELHWDVTDLYQTGAIRVVPEPSALACLGAFLCVCAVIRPAAAKRFRLGAFQHKQRALQRIDAS